MAAAALGGYVLCGINNTRRGEALATDISRADCQFLLTDAEHLPLLDGLDLAGVTRPRHVAATAWSATAPDRGTAGPAPRGRGRRTRS